MKSINTKKILVLISMLILIATTIQISAINSDDNHEEEIAKAKEIIKNKIQCDDLTLEQIEILGDYYMEQMHPGELHEIMDERMGGEGSASLRQVHINIGRMFYCGESQAMSSGMMNMMMGRNMMSSGNIMNPINNEDNLFNSRWVFSWLFGALIIIVLILLIVLLIKKTK